MRFETLMTLGVEKLSRDGTTRGVARIIDDWGGTEGTLAQCANGYLRWSSTKLAYFGQQANSSLKCSIELISTVQSNPARIRIPLLKAPCGFVTPPKGVSGARLGVFWAAQLRISCEQHNNHARRYIVGPRVLRKSAIGETSGRALEKYVCECLSGTLSPASASRILFLASHRACVRASHAFTAALVWAYPLRRSPFHTRPDPLAPLLPRPAPRSPSRRPPAQTLPLPFWQRGY